jgi:hypothetical protein
MSFTTETPARQLGALAATLARIASSSIKPTRTAATGSMLAECIDFIEHLTPLDSSKTLSEINDLQTMLILWRDSWSHAQQNESQRKLLSLQARKWSDQVLEYSGLLNIS